MNTSEGASTTNHSLDVEHTHMELIRCLNAMPLMPGAPSERLQAILRLYRPMSAIEQRELEYTSAQELRAAADALEAAAANFRAQADVVASWVRAATVEL